MPRATVASPHAPKAIGPYAQANWAGDLLYCSGQTPIDPAVGQLIAGDVEAQTHRCFDNLQAVVEAAGLTMDDVIKCNVYLTDMADFLGVKGTLFKSKTGELTLAATELTFLGNNGGCQ